MIPINENAKLAGLALWNKNTNGSDTNKVLAQRLLKNTSQAIAWASSLPLPADLKLVLTALASVCGEDGRAFNVRLKMLAKRCNLNFFKVLFSLRKLKNLQVIGGGGRGLYYLRIKTVKPEVFNKGGSHVR